VDGLSLEDRMVLDIGCGRGGTCSFLSRYFRPRQVVGLEYSRSCLALCRRAHPLPRLSFVCGDAAALPFSAASFDVVTNIESSHCYPAPWLFFAEVRRVLRPGGVFCYTDVFGDLEEPARARRRLEALGFVVERQDDITGRVARGLTAGYADFERLLRGMVSEQRDNGELVESMLDSIKRIPEEAYASGKAVYVAWRLRTPAEHRAEHRVDPGAIAGAD
jgi:O-methyltransferase